MALPAMALRTWQVPTHGREEPAKKTSEQIDLNKAPEAVTSNPSSISEDVTRQYNYRS